MDLREFEKQCAALNSSALEKLLNMLRSGRLNLIPDILVCDFVPARSAGSPDIIVVRLSLGVERKFGAAA